MQANKRLPMLEVDLPNELDGYTRARVLDEVRGAINQENVSFRMEETGRGFHLIDTERGKALPPHEYYQQPHIKALKNKIDPIISRITGKDPPDIALGAYKEFWTYQQGLPEGERISFDEWLKQNYSSESDVQSWFDPAYEEMAKSSGTYAKRIQPKPTGEMDAPTSFPSRLGKGDEDPSKLISLAAFHSLPYMASRYVVRPGEFLNPLKALGRFQMNLLPNGHGWDIQRLTSPLPGSGWHNTKLGSVLTNRLGRHEDLGMRWQHSPDLFSLWDALQMGAAEHGQSQLYGLSPRRVVYPVNTALEPQGKNIFNIVRSSPTLLGMAGQEVNPLWKDFVLQGGTIAADLAHRKKLSSKIPLSEWTSLRTSEITDLWGRRVGTYEELQNRLQAHTGVWGRSETQLGLHPKHGYGLAVTDKYSLAAMPEELKALAHRYLSSLKLNPKEKTFVGPWRYGGDIDGKGVTLKDASLMGRALYLGMEKLGLMQPAEYRAFVPLNEMPFWNSAERAKIANFIKQNLPKSALSDWR